MYNKPEVCVLPVAGLSTRNLPTTKVLHKGFMTLDSKPVIQYAVDACAEAGIKEIVFIYSDDACKNMFQKYYAPAPELESHLAQKGKNDLLEVVRRIIPSGMKFSFARQAEPKGNGHAILMAKEIIGKRDFAVMWVDDVYINLHGDGVLKQLCDIYTEKGGIVENIMECPREEMVRYGALIGAKRDGNVVRASGLVEKPKLEEVPSNYASMGPYIIPNEVLDILPEVTKGSNGEINLTDALNLAAVRGMPIYGVLTKGMRFDCGTNADLQKANIKLAVNCGPIRAIYWILWIFSSSVKQKSRRQRQRDFCCDFQTIFFVVILRREVDTALLFFSIFSAFMTPVAIICPTRVFCSQHKVSAKFTRFFSNKQITVLPIRNLPISSPLLKVIFSLV